jgi:hypothetical protein
MNRVIAVLCCVGFLSIASNALGVITLTPNGMSTQADVFYPFQQHDQTIVSTNPGVAVASSPGSSYLSTTTGSFVSIGDSATFTTTFDQKRLGTRFDQASGVFSANFTTTVPVYYFISGYYENSGGQTNLSAHLWHGLVVSDMLSVQESFGGPELFTVGGYGGNFYNQFSGSLSGILLPGETYTWIASTYSRAEPTDDLGAVASGTVTLTIGPAVGAVPEASSVIVWSLLSLSIGGIGWWQKRKRAA